MSKTPLTNNEIRPQFGQYLEDEQLTGVEGWRIGTETAVWIYDHSDLVFVRESDCLRAIESLRVAGYCSLEDMDGLSDSELARICCSDLAW